MSELSPEDAQAVDRLSFFLLREAYSASTGLLRQLNPEMAKTMFDQIEIEIERALQTIHEQQSEGPASTVIVTAIAERLIGILDEARDGSERPGTDPGPSGGGQFSPTGSLGLRGRAA